jgi:hypothetical protein
MKHKDYPRLPKLAQFLVGGLGPFEVDVALMEAIWKRLKEGRAMEEVLPEPMMLIRDIENSEEWYITCFMQSENQERQK